MEKWNKEIEKEIMERNSLRIYKSIRVKGKRKRLEFLSNPDRAGARILSRLRSGSSDLEAAKERTIPDKTKRRPPHQRHCRLCGKILNLTDEKNHIKPEHKETKKLSTEDIIHFLMECRMFKEERKDLIKKNRWKKVSWKNLKLKFTGIEKKIKAITNLLEYIRNIYNIRNRILNKKSINEEWWVTRTF